MPSVDEKPFVETTIARFILSRLTLTHEERGLSIMSGPWGIGKTTALEEFARRCEGKAVIVKLTPGSRGRQATAVSVLQLVAEALREQVSRRPDRVFVGTSAYPLRTLIYKELEHWEPYRFGPQLHHEHHDRESFNDLPPFTIIFDEAQYVSKEALEFMRFWNDRDRTSGPFPVGLFFIGNPEFSLKDDGSEKSIMSGAIKSRALFVDPLDYTYLTDSDITLFIQSRGITDAGAIRTLFDHLNASPTKHDLRALDRLIRAIHRRADGPITAALVRTILFP